MTTDAPSCANSTEISRPSPGPSPVTTTTLSCSSTAFPSGGVGHLEELDGRAVGVLDVEAARAGARDLDDRGGPVGAEREDLGVLGVHVVDVDAQVRVAGMVVPGRHRLGTGGVVADELHREAVEGEHGDLDVGAVVPGQGVEPLPGQTERRRADLEAGHVAVE